MEEALESGVCFLMFGRLLNPSCILIAELMVMDSSLVYLGPCLLLCVLCFFSRLLREQWIRAKYERKEFIHSEKQEPYSAGSQRNFGQISVLMSIAIPFPCLCLYLLHIDYFSYVANKV